MKNAQHYLNFSLISGTTTVKSKCPYCGAGNDTTFCGLYTGVVSAHKPELCWYCKNKFRVIVYGTEIL
jgi:uncharacterized Zn-finger protein